jgi:hypothetical protein
MPRSRSGAVTTNVHSTIRCPGAYAHALRKVCERDAAIGAPCYLTLADVDAPAWHRANAERVAALLPERTGKPVNAQSHIGLQPPFDHWPRGGSRGSFMVTPDDVITFKPRGMFRRDERKSRSRTDFRALA